MLQKVFTLILLTLALAACKTTKKATEVSAASRTFLADSTHTVRVAVARADSSTVVALLTIDSLTLAPVAVESRVSWGGGLQTADKQRGDTSQVAESLLSTRDNSSRLRPVRVYGLRLAVNSTAVTQAAGDSLQHSAKTAESEETATHSAETSTASKPAASVVWGFYLGFFLLLAALAYFLYQKHGKA